MTEIDDVVAAFFAAFDNRDGRVPAIDDLARLFLPGAIVMTRDAASTRVFSVPEFLAPRQRLLADGTLLAFHEWEVSSETIVDGGIASRVSRYAKSGMLHGAPYDGHGTKCFQLARTPEGWRIAAVLWEDAAGTIAGGVQPRAE